MSGNFGWTDPELSALLAAIRKTPWRQDGDLAHDLARHLARRTYDAIRVQLGKLRIEHNISEKGLPRPEDTGYIQRFDAPLQVTGDCMVAGDFQVPFYHVEATQRLLAIAQKLGIKQLIIGGDFFDLPYWSTFDRTLMQQQLTWTDDKAIGRRIFAELLEWFDRIYITADNHSLRYFRKTEFKESISAFYGGVVGDALATKVSVSESPIVTVNDVWAVVHPAAYRQLKLSSASALAMKLEKNIFVFPGHLAEKGISKYVNWLIVDGGCMTDSELHEYVAHKITPHPNWNVGFYALKDNYPREFWFHPLYPWGEWLDGQDRHD